MVNLAKIKEYINKATAGPWSNDCCKGLCPAGISSENHPICHVVVGKWGDDYPTLQYEDGKKVGLANSGKYVKYDVPIKPVMDLFDFGEIDREQAKANSDFIAMARTDLPLLVKEIEELTEDQIHSNKIQNEMAELIEKQAQEIKRLKQEIINVEKDLQENMDAAYHKGAMSNDIDAGAL